MIIRQTANTNSDFGATVLPRFQYISLGPKHFLSSYFKIWCLRTVGHNVIRFELSIPFLKLTSSLSFWRLSKRRSLLLLSSGHCPNGTSCSVSRQRIGIFLSVGWAAGPYQRLIKSDYRCATSTMLVVSLLVCLLQLDCCLKRII